MKKRKHKCCRCERYFFSVAHGVYRCRNCRIEHNKELARERSSRISKIKGRICAKYGCQREITSTALYCEPCRVKRKLSGDTHIDLTANSSEEAKESLKEARTVFREPRRIFTSSQMQWASPEKFARMIKKTVEAW